MDTSRSFDLLSPLPEPWDLSDSPSPPPPPPSPSPSPSPSPPPPSPPPVFQPSAWQLGTVWDMRYNPEHMPHTFKEILRRSPCYMKEGTPFAFLVHIAIRFGSGPNCPPAIYTTLHDPKGVNEFAILQAIYLLLQGDLGSRIGGMSLEMRERVERAKARSPNENYDRNLHMLGSRVVFDGLVLESTGGTGYVVHFEAKFISWTEALERYKRV